jgi:ATP-dependent Clp protease ATP-binding subunit ClpA
MYRRLEAVADASGLSINAILTVSCIEWMDTHFPLGGHSSAGLGDGESVGRERRPFGMFTPAAKNAIERVPQVAEAAGAGRMGVEHLALALADVPDGVAACVLGRLDVDRLKLAGALGVAEHPGAAGVEPLGPTDGVKQAIELAFASSAKFAPVLGQDEMLGTGHLLLGLLSSDDGSAARALEQLGVTEEAVRREMERCRRAGVTDGG